MMKKCISVKSRLIKTAGVALHVILVMKVLSENFSFKLMF